MEVLVLISFAVITNYHKFNALKQQIYLGYGHLLRGHYSAYNN
jgi:hypothetical protein